MKPLTEQELREKIQDIFNDCTSGWLITIKNFNGEDRSLESLENEIIDDILTLTTQDRKAWGEHVIGEDKWSNDTGTIGTNNQTIKKSTYIHVRNALRAEQRQRNQGEKNDATL